MILRAFLPQEEDDFQNAEEELELDQSSELYKTIVAAIIKEDDDCDIEEEDGDIGEDVYDEEKTPARDAEVKTDSEAGGGVIKRFVKVASKKTKLLCEINLLGQAVPVLGDLMRSEQEFKWNIKSGSILF